MEFLYKKGKNVEVGDDFTFFPESVEDECFVLDTYGLNQEFAVGLPVDEASDFVVYYHEVAAVRLISQAAVKQVRHLGPVCPTGPRQDQ
jgi:hypothetical protein